MLYWDLDGVLRDLAYYVMGHEATDWNEKINGKSFFDIVEEDKTILYKVPCTQYLPIALSICPEISIISSQLSHHWETLTDKWIKDKICKYIPVNVQYVSKPEDKLKIIGENDLLVEDFPFFENYSQIVLVDHLYNQILPNAKNNPITIIKNKNEMKKFLMNYYK